MKTTQVVGYALGFLFIAVCALLTANANRAQEQPQPAPPPDGTRPARTSYGPAAPALTLEQRIASRDLDGDGRVSLEEWMDGRSYGDLRFDEWRRRFFAAVDRDNDGYLTVEEGRQFDQRMRHAIETAVARFEALDGDSDGRLSLEEALADSHDGNRPSWVAETFERYDRDGDGVLDMRELRIGVFTGLTQPPDLASDPAGPPAP